jgi:hypothetical protein
MFNLGGGDRAKETTQGGRTDRNMGATMGLRHNSGGSISNDWDDTSNPLRDDPSAPNVGVRFGEPGEHGELGRANNAFALGTRGEPTNTSDSTPPVEITQWTVNTQDETPHSSPLATPTGMQYSGMTTAIRRGGLGSTATMTQDLMWQQAVRGDTGKINQWKDVMGSLQEFKAYLFIKQGTCFATALHSPMKFAVINASTAHLQGRVIGFVGDRTATREPTPILLLPTNKTWQWVKEAVFTDGIALIKYFDDDPTRSGTLWKGEGASDTTKRELHAPRLISIPLWLLEKIKQEGRALMPYEILRIIMTHLEEVNTQEYADAWATVTAWWVLASQGNTTGDNLMSFAIEAITEEEDEYLGKWLEQRLDTTMGPRPQGGGRTAVSGTQRVDTTMGPRPQGGGTTAVSGTQWDPTQAPLTHCS